MKINRRQFVTGSIAALSSLGFSKYAFSSNPDVIVIGAGAAGLAATSHLIENGYSVTCIEADNRIGGRVHTDNDTFGVPYDIGAHWVQNGRYNPFKSYGLKVKDKGFHLYPEQETEWLVMDGNKKINGTEDEDSLWAQYDAAEYAISKAANKDIPPSEVIPAIHPEWYDTVHLNIGPYSMAKDYSNFSCIDWYNYAPESQDWICKEGYGALVAYRWRNIPVSLNTEAYKINWDNSNNVKVVTNKGTISAKACVVTVSTSAFNSGKIKFTPALPIEKYEAYDAFSCSNYNHVTLQLKDDFYKEYKVKPDMYFTPKITTKGLKSPEGYCSTMNLHDSKISYFDVGGQFAKDLEKAGSKAGIDFVLQTLRDTFGSDFDKFFVKGHMTSWGKNPRIFGIGGSDNNTFFLSDNNLLNPDYIDNVIYNDGVGTEYEFWSMNNLIYPLRGYNIGQKYGKNALILNLEFRLPFLMYYFPAIGFLGKINSVFFSDLGVVWNDNFPDIANSNSWDEDLDTINGYNLYQNYQDSNNAEDLVRVTQPEGWIWTFGFGPRFILLGMPWQIDFAWQYNPITNELSSRRWYVSIGLDF